MLLTTSTSPMSRCMATGQDGIAMQRTALASTTPTTRFPKTYLTAHTSGIVMLATTQVIVLLIQQTEPSPLTAHHPACKTSRIPARIRVS